MGDAVTDWQIVMIVSIVVWAWIIVAKVGR